MVVQLLLMVYYNIDYDSLAIILIGNIITGIVWSKSTDMQITLRVSDVSKYSFAIHMMI